MKIRFHRSILSLKSHLLHLLTLVLIEIHTEKSMKIQTGELKPKNLLIEKFTSSKITLP